MIGTVDDLIITIEEAIEKKIQVNDLILGPSSKIKSLDFVQIIAAIEDKYFASLENETDLLNDFCLSHEEATVNDLYTFLNK